MQLELTGQATRDIELIHRQGVIRFGVNQAQHYLQGLLDQLDLIASNPEMARVRPGFSRPMQLQRYKSHMIFYRIDGDVIVVVRILHSKQNWSEICEPSRVTHRHGTFGGLRRPEGLARSCSQIAFRVRGRYG